MSKLESKMASVTKGNLATSEKLRALFAPEGGAGAGTPTRGRVVETDPALKANPELA